MNKGLVLGQSQDQDRPRGPDWAKLLWPMHGLLYVYLRIFGPFSVGQFQGLSMGQTIREGSLAIYSDPYGVDQSDLDTRMCSTHHKLSVGTLPAPNNSDLMHLSGTQPEKPLMQICLDSCCGPRHAAAHSNLCGMFSVSNHSLRLNRGPR